MPKMKEMRHTVHEKFQNEKEYSWITSIDPYMPCSLQKIKKKRCIHQSGSDHILWPVFFIE